MYSYTPNFMPQSILVVGCGGTGSRLIPQIAQFVKTCGWVLNPEMVIVDDDAVEEKNLRRQNFVKQDVGKKKAAVLAQRYAKAYDINITPIMERVVQNNTNLAETEFYKKIRTWRNNSTPVMVILCVDSAEARRDIVQLLAQTLLGSITLLIDTGNENDFGQVKFSNLVMPISLDSTYSRFKRTVVENKLPVPGVIPLQHLPVDVDYYMGMVSTEAPSCADLDQTMAINSLVATVTFGLIQNWYYAKPFTTHKVNVSLAHGCIPEYINHEYIGRLVEIGNVPRKHAIFSAVNRVDFTGTLDDAEKMVSRHLHSIKKMEEAEAKKKIEAEMAAAAATMAPVEAVAEVKVIDADSSLVRPRSKKVSPAPAPAPEPVHVAPIALDETFALGA